MPKRVPPLSDLQIRNAKPQAKEVKLFDGGGLYLSVQPSGGKLWRLKYRFEGREKKLSLGAFPAVSLAVARQKREEAKSLIAQGINPSEWKKNKTLTSETFKDLAQDWLALQESSLTPKHRETVEARLKTYIFPHLGNRPVVQITSAELLAVLRKIEAKGIIETAHRVKQITGVRL